MASKQAVASANDRFTAWARGWATSASDHGMATNDEKTPQASRPLAKALTNRWDLGNTPQQFMAGSSTRFGFVAFAETWDGRLAMLGFVIGLTTERLKRAERFNGRAAMLGIAHRGTLSGQGGGVQLKPLTEVGMQIHGGVLKGWRSRLRGIAMVIRITDRGAGSGATGPWRCSG